MRTRSVSLTFAGAAALLLGPQLPVAASAPPTDPLPIGTTATNTIVSSAEPARFLFTSPASGVLLVAVQADDDVRLDVTYADGTPLPDSSADRDLMNDPGTEQLAVSIPAAGDFIVVVELHPWSSGDSSTFEIGGAFLEIDGRAFSADADGPTRDQAIELGVGEEYTDGEVLLGDLVDWFRLTADQDGALLVQLVGLDADEWLQVEVQNETRGESAYGSGNPAETSLAVAAGDTVFLRVSVSGAPAGGYTLSTEYGEADPDGTQADARVLEVGDSYEDTERVISDREDWFSITAPRAGMLTITTSALDDFGPDLQLELYLDDSGISTDYSDQDLDGTTAESLTVDVTEGQTVFVLVRTFGNSPPTNYRITAELD